MKSYLHTGKSLAQVLLAPVGVQDPFPRLRKECRGKMAGMSRMMLLHSKKVVAASVSLHFSYKIDRSKKLLFLG